MLLLHPLQHADICLSPVPHCSLRATHGQSALRVSANRFPVSLMRTPTEFLSIVFVASHVQMRASACILHHYQQWCW